MKKRTTLFFLSTIACFQLTAQCNPDTEPPVIKVMNDFCMNFIQGKITLWAEDFIITAQDNCTNKDNIQFAVRKSGAGTGFPIDSAGNRQASVTYSCNEHGLQLIEVWARDEAGNITRDSSLVGMADKFWTCNIDPLWGSGCAWTEQNKLIMNTVWNFDLEPPVVFHHCFPQPGYSAACLNYMFIGKTSTAIRPTLDLDPLNGVSTLDLILINKHILGLDTLDSPYKILAADVNDSKSVSMFDIIELRKLILGVYSELPNRDSWGFVLKSFVFPDPTNPFGAAVPSTLLYVYHKNDDQNFIGYKVGDVNGNAVPSLQAPPVDDRAGLRLWGLDTLLQPGQTARIPLRLGEALDLQGLQFALEFDPSVLEISGLSLSERLTSSQPLTAPETYFAQPQAGLLTFSWNTLNAPQLPAGEAVVFLEIKALQPVQISEALRLQPERLRPELYTAEGASHRLHLDFLAALKIEQTQLFPATPNPSSGAVRIPMALAENGTVLIEIFDLNGRRVYRQEQVFLAGLNGLEVPATVFSGLKGLLFYRVVAGDFVGTGKLVRG